MFSSQLVGFLKKNRKRKIVFTNGCFDILHFGHVKLLNEAKKLGDVLIVGLNSDASVKKIKGLERPIINEDERKFLLENLKSVDFVEIFSQETPLELIKEIRPNFLIKGGDWDLEKIVGAEFVNSYGGSVQNIPYIKGKSTTEILTKILKI